MRVLMLGWEFPPNQSGGLGTACYGITRALLRKGTDVLFVMPYTHLKEHPDSHVKLRSASGTMVPEVVIRERQLRDDFLSGQGVPRPPLGREASREHVLRPATAGSGARTIEELHYFTSRMVMRGIRSSLRPYVTAESYEEYLEQVLANKSSRTEAGEEGLPPLIRLERWKEALAASPLAQSGPNGQTVTDTGTVWNKIELHGGYGKDLMSEVYRYSLACAQIAMEEDFDVVHVHDWMTYPAGILIKQLTGKPLVAHIHALEHDRSGEGVNPEIAHIEWAGMTAADTVVAVSYYTKNEVMRQYAIPDENVLTHSMVAYGNPNHWQKRKHRGRKRCGMLLALPASRTRLGLLKKPAYDPDIRAGRLADADPELTRILYTPMPAPKAAPKPPAAKPAAQTPTKPPAQPPAKPAAVSASNVIGPKRSAWDIARDQYDAPTTLYAFPDGTTKRGDQIKNWNKMPAGTIVTVGPAASENANEGLLTIGEDGSAQDLAGDAIAATTTFYFRPGKPYAAGATLPLAEIAALPAGTKVLVDYRVAGPVTAKTPVFSLCGNKWNHSDTYYWTSAGGLVPGDQVTDRTISKGSLVFFRK